MYCNACSAGNPSDSKFCKECGARFDAGYRSLLLSVQDHADIADQDAQDSLAKMLDMAFWHNEAGNTEAAILACESALAINRNSTTAHSLLATLYEKKGEDSKAIEHLESVLALNPESEADAAKLDQLRRGVHVRAAAPPVGYRWVPPALAGAGIASLGGKWDTLSQASQAKRIGIATAATLAVLTLGYFLLKPTGPTQATPPVRLASAVPTARSSYAPVASALPPPIVLSARGGGQMIFSNRDPFAERLKPGEGQPAFPSASLPSFVQSAPRPAATVRRSASDASLPPLNLRAVPIPRAVPPAPVTIPAGTSSLPQHTVVVQNLNAPSAGSPTSTPAVYNADPTPQRIRITINHENAPITETLPAASASAAESSADGDRQQQAALAAQQRGDLRAARAAYTKAIRAYKAQIAAGHETETAQRGLQACQTGLQICQQSQ